MGTITRIPTQVTPSTSRRVAAYVRVSKESERLTHSFSAQVSYYNRLIASTPGWVFAGVYSDYAATGTTTAKRQEFNDMIAAALAGEIDIILTKSISRFARNTVDLLATCQELKNAGVEVWFERENINTASAEGEILLTLLASFAQAESESISQNAKWGIRKKYAQGRIHSCHPYGYRYVRDHLEVIESEAVVVRRLFEEYLAGKSPEKIARELNEEGYRPRAGKCFRGKMLRKLLENEHYVGNSMCQKTYRPKIADTNSQRNTGELPRYLVEDSHPAIIDPEIFARVQAELARRRASGGCALTPGGRNNALTHHLECTVCHAHYQRRTKKKTTKTVKYWWCETATKGKGNPCRAHQLEETRLKNLTIRVLELQEWDDETIIDLLENISVGPDYKLTFLLKNGTIRSADYRDRGEARE
ncbi:MAG: recombinase family protein [Mobiluncus sp.]|uniref:recombinase family protein n=1 Tax=Mobiluncus sp. TaxID=47293 RepID=UPI002586452F|nr:recombinase family protein [Mobiluncus sp.]MCI6584807.1 recombinase family protein [Mobiluncus sp.]